MGQHLKTYAQFSPSLWLQNAKIMSKQKPSSISFTPFNTESVEQTFLIWEVRYDSKDLENTAAEAFFNDVVMSIVEGVQGWVDGRDS